MIYLLESCFQNEDTLKETVKDLCNKVKSAEARTMDLKAMADKKIDE